MEKKIEDIEKLSPERLMRMFSRSPIILAWIMSILIHVGLGAATSWDDAWAMINGKQPSWEKKKAGIEETNTTASATGTVSSATGVVASVTGTVAVATGAVASVSETNLTGVATNELVPGSAEHTAAMMKKYSNAPVIQAITEISTNIPKVADDLGISIKDTDPFNK